jgi:hypothetical protein
MKMTCGISRKDLGYRVIPLSKNTLVFRSISGFDSVYSD